MKSLRRIFVWTIIGLLVTCLWFIQQDAGSFYNDKPTEASKALGFVTLNPKGSQQTTKQLSSTKRVKPVVFVKTHKTGSTTIRSLLLEYVFSREERVTLASAFPMPFVGGYPGRIRFKFVHPPEKQIQAIFDHSRFDADELQRHMPNDTIYFSILREPWSQFQSAYNFYLTNVITRPAMNFTCFHMPIDFVLNKRSMDQVTFMHECARTLDKSVPWYFRFKNYQAHDLGFDPTLEDKDEIEKQIKALDDNMDLVMITEYLQESLILLKDQLDLDWSDIIPRWTKKRKYEKMNLGTTDRQVFSKHNNLDIALYRHFNATLWRKVELYGRKRMSDDLIKFNKVISQKRHRREAETLDISKAKKWDLSSDLREYMAENSGNCFIPAHD